MVDFISSFIASQDNLPFTLFAEAFSDPLFALTFIIFCSSLLLWKKTDRVTPLFLALVLAFVLIDPLKSFLLVPRPCAELAAKIPCPADASMPSGHAVVAGIFLLASVGTMFFPYFLPVAFLVALSRIYLGIHTLADVSAGIAVGATIYAACEKAINKYRKAIE